MQPTGLQRGLLDLTKINFISRFYALFLTTAVGHGVVRWHKVTKDQGDRAKFITVIALERLTFLLVVLWAAILSITLISGSQLESLKDGLLPLLYVCFAMVAVIFSALLSQSVYAFIQGLLIHIISLFSKKLQALLKSIDFRVSYTWQPIAQTLFWAIFWHLLFLLRVWLLFLALDVPLGFVDAAWMASLAILVQALPVSFSGIGIREAAYAFFFKLQGLEPETGVVIGVLFFTQMLLMAVIGGILEVSSKD